MIFQKKGSFTAVIIFVAFLVLSMLSSPDVHALKIPGTTRDACISTSHGVWCNKEMYCIAGDGIRNDASADICTVSDEQNITLPDSISDHKYFNFKSLNITKSGRVQFFTSVGTSAIPNIANLPSPLVVLAGGQTVGGQMGCIPADNRWGGPGGAGGSTLASGGGGTAYSCSGSPIAGGGGMPGAYVTLVVQKLEIRGFLSVDGAIGGVGEHALDDDGNGCAGAGGGGGGGGGILEIFTANAILGDGYITANGGKGGFGGLPTDDSGDICGGSGDYGGGGGHGGGGAAGYVLIGATIDYSSLQIQMNGGKGGSWDNDAEAYFEANGWSDRNCLCQGAQPAGDGKKNTDIINYIPEKCNNLIDDDGNQRIDMDDPWCYNAAANGMGWDTSLHAIFNASGSPYHYDRSSKNGTDGSCGDDPELGYCDNFPSINCATLDYYYCTLYSSRCRWNGASCQISGLIKPAVPPDGCAALSQDECYQYSSTCHWFDVLELGHDYGFIDPTGQYLCYNNKTRIKSPPPDDQWEWFNAKDSDVAFRIMTLQINNNTVDMISNSNSWSFCNANPIYSKDINATPIKDLETFNSSTNSNEISCSYAYTAIYGVPFEDLESCDSTTGKNCCQMDTSVQPAVPWTTPTGDAANACEGQCFTSDGHEADICAIKPEICDQGGELPDAGTTTDLVDKSACNFDLSGCIQNIGADPKKKCTDQTPKGKICTSDQFCTGGTFIKTTEHPAPGQRPADAGCCYGAAVECIPKEELSEQRCEELGGTLYDPLFYYCANDEAIVNSMSKCCFSGDVAPLPSFKFNWYGAVDPKSFICSKQSGDNVITQCVYDNSTLNAGLSNGVRIDSAKNRLLSKGSPLHTILNFDQFKDGFVVDSVKRIGISGAGGVSGTGNLKPISDQSAYVMMNNFTYLTFDIAYPKQGKDMELILVTLDSVTRSQATQKSRSLGLLSQYLVDGNNEMRWHRAVIDLKNNLTPALSASGENYWYMQLKAGPDASQAFNVVVDNIVLVPADAEDFKANSQNYYCTGAFGTWISNLDPTMAFSNTTFYDDPMMYGPYKFACEAQSSFAWTGRQCCGDKTMFNYGEHYNDSQSGCFNGTIVQNDWTVSYSKNVPEGTSEFEDYIFKDLIYYDNEYKACQADPAKYNGKLVLSYDGLKNAGAHNLVNNYTGDQCAVVGSYYCMNNAWRQKMEGYTGNDTLSSLGVTLKTAPPGVNLVHNGKFGG